MPLFFFANCAVYEITWENTVQPDRPQMTIWRMRVACWLTKATNTHSEYVIIIVFFFHYDSGCMNASQCYGIPILPIIILVMTFHLYSRFVIAFFISVFPTENLMVFSFSPVRVTWCDLYF